MKYRKLRIAWSVLFSLLCLLLIALWVRSYWSSVREILMYVTLSERPLIMDSRPGRMTMFFAPGTGWMGLGNETLTVSAVDGWPDAPSAGFRFVRALPYGFFIIVPHWFLVLMAASVAMIPWITWRFSLRTLLIGMTIVAAILGLVVWTVK